MKKLTSTLLCLLLILSIAFCLAGCKSREQRLSEETAYEDAQMKAMNKKVIKCINEKDKEGLKKLFSKSAQKDIEGLDGKIDELMNLYGDNKIIYAHSDTPGSSGSLTIQPLSITGEFLFKLSNGKQYVGWISFCDKDDENKDNVGLKTIELCNGSKEELPEDFIWDGISSGNPDIFIHYIN